MKDNINIMTEDNLSTRLPICLFKEVTEKYSKARDLNIYNPTHGMEEKELYETTQT
jgi:hypothetical protein